MKVSNERFSIPQLRKQLLQSTRGSIHASAKRPRLSVKPAAERRGQGTNNVRVKQSAVIASQHAKAPSSPHDRGSRLKNSPKHTPSHDQDQASNHSNILSARNTNISSTRGSPALSTETLTTSCQSTSSAMQSHNSTATVPLSYNEHLSTTFAQRRPPSMAVHIQHQANEPFRRQQSTNSQPGQPQQSVNSINPNNPNFLNNNNNSNNLHQSLQQPQGLFNNSNNPAALATSGIRQISQQQQPSLPPQQQALTIYQNSSSNVNQANRLGRNPAHTQQRPQISTAQSYNSTLKSSVNQHPSNSNANGLIGHSTNNSHLVHNNLNQGLATLNQASIPQSVQQPVTDISASWKMAFQPPGDKQAAAGRKILEDLQQKKQMLLLKNPGNQNSAGTPAQSATGASEAHVALSQSQRTALTHAHQLSPAYYITQDSSFGNLIIPVLPRQGKPFAV